MIRKAARPGLGVAAATAGLAALASALLPLIPEGAALAGEAPTPAVAPAEAHPGGEGGEGARLSAPLSLAELARRKAFAHRRSREDRISSHSRELPVPLPGNLADFIADPTAAIALGKAFFWDVQVSSDGKVACATCHHAAGADPRTKNVVFSDIEGDFPGADRELKEVANPGDSGRTFDAGKHWSIGSEGIRLTRFLGLKADGTEEGKPLADVADLTVAEREDEGLMHRIKLYKESRQVTVRNAPTVINAVFNDRQFHDGRASNAFNGFDHLGDLGEPERNQIGRWRVVGGTPRLLPYLRIENASLASQAVRPPLTEFEMSYLGRTFVDIGRKLLGRTPLAGQQVAKGDSALGRYSAGKGLTLTYRDLIRRAFRPEWWDSGAELEGYLPSLNAPPVARPEGWHRPIGAPPDGVRRVEFSLMEGNFSLYFGLSVMLYESTLVSDDAPFDRFVAGDDKALSLPQQQGFANLVKFDCIDCHMPPTFSGATVAAVRGELREDDAEADAEDSPDFVPDPQGLEVVEWMKIDPFAVTRAMRPYDSGFYNLGVSPASKDLGVGSPLRDVPAVGRPRGVDSLRMAQERSSRIRQANPEEGTYREQKAAPPAAGPAPKESPPTFSVSQRRFGDVAVFRRAFKTPSLRNVRLTGPYMHDGSYRDLDSVVDFYRRGGDFPSVEDNPDLHPRMREFAATRPNDRMIDEELGEIVEFLEGGLTDERVVKGEPPFDHPSLDLPDGRPAFPDAGQKKD